MILTALCLTVILVGCRENGKSAKSSRGSSTPERISFVKKGYESAPFYWLDVSDSSSTPLGKDSMVHTIIKTEAGKIIGIEVPSKYDTLGKIAKFSSLGSAYKAILKESKAEFEKRRKSDMTDEVELSMLSPSDREKRVAILKASKFGAREIAIKGEIETDSTGNKVSKEYVDYIEAQISVGGGAEQTGPALAYDKRYLTLTSAMPGVAKVYDKTYGGYFGSDSLILTERTKNTVISLDGMKQKHMTVSDD